MRLSRPLIVAPLVGLLLLSLHLVGCGDDGGDAPSAADAAASDLGQADEASGPDPVITGEPRGACAVGDVTGLFEIVYGKNFSYFSGDVSAFPKPAVPPEELLATGACTVRRQVQLSCSSPCEGGSVCGTEGSCVDAPGSQGVGTVSVFGLLKEVSLEPTEGTGFYMESSLPHPPFEPGAASATCARKWAC